MRQKPHWALVLRAQLLAGLTAVQAIGTPVPARQTRFVVLSHGRSGSTLLVDLIASHSGVHCDQEILSHPLLVTSALRHVEQRARLFGSLAYGFKLRPNHFATQQIEDPARFMRRLHDDGWRVVHLVRRNVVRTALSFLRVQQTGVFHQRARGGAVERYRFHVDPEALIAGAEQVEHEQGVELAALEGIPRLTLHYEDDLLDAASQQAALNRLFDYLELSSVTVSSEFVRLTGDRLAEVIANYDEVAARLAGTRYEPLLVQP